MVLRSILIVVVLGACAIGFLFGRRAGDGPREAARSRPTDPGLIAELENEPLAPAALPGAASEAALAREHVAEVETASRPHLKLRFVSAQTHGPLANIAFEVGVAEDEQTREPERIWRRDEEVEIVIR